MARHALENPTRHRSQMSGEQRKRSASKKSARAIAASHRRQADASYEAMLEAQDDAWEGGEYQGRYAYDAYKNPRMETINVVVESGGKATAAFSLKADVDALWNDLKDEYRDETDRLWLAVRGKMSGGPSRASRVQFDWPRRTLTFYTTRSNPFLVTLGGQAVGVPDYSDAELEELHSRGLTIPVRGRRFDKSHHRRAAAGAAFAEEEGFTLTIKKVGDEYRIIDNHGNDLQKYAYRLEKAQEILEKLLAKQA